MVEIEEILRKQETKNVSYAMEFAWLESLIHYRIRELCGNVENVEFPAIPKPPSEENDFYDDLIKLEVSDLERIALSLALTAQTMPQFLDYLYTKNKYTDKIFTEFGVEIDSTTGRIVPTWKTAMFLFVGNKVNEQFELLNHVHFDHHLYTEKLLSFPSEKASNPFLTKLRLTEQKMHEWSFPKNVRNLADADFPAHEISSPLEWNDLFVNEQTQIRLNDLRMWFKHEKEIREYPKINKHINPGMRVLFYGPSGTGKTLTASLLGKEFKLPVYRVDLSQMVSKWIGETEKNLARVFDIAEKRKWILFFDEADALFSKRGSVSNSNDRRSNQEISYLLQRVENYDGTIIMATNLKDNIDEAFARRFQLIIEFPVPNKSIRLKMWKRLLEDTFPLDSNVNLENIANRYEIAGGSMKNIFRALMLRVIDRPLNERTISAKDLTLAIEQELSKTGTYIVQNRY